MTQYTRVFEKKKAVEMWTYPSLIFVLPPDPVPRVYLVLTNSPISLEDLYPLVLCLTDISASCKCVARTSFLAWLASRFRNRAPGIAFFILLKSVGGANNSGPPPPALLSPSHWPRPDSPQCSLTDPKRTKIQIDETKCTRASDSSLTIGRR